MKKQVKKHHIHEPFYNSVKREGGVEEKGERERRREESLKNSTPKW